MARRNTYREDEVLETPFDYHHLLRAFVYIKKYLGRMIFAFILSAIGGITALFGPKITQIALDEAIPDGNVKKLFTLVALLCGCFILSIIFLLGQATTLAHRLAKHLRCITRLHKISPIWNYFRLFQLLVPSLICRNFKHKSHYIFHDNNGFC